MYDFSLSIVFSEQFFIYLKDNLVFRVNQIFKIIFIETPILKKSSNSNMISTFFIKFFIFFNSKYVVL